MVSSIFRVNRVLQYYLAFSVFLTNETKVDHLHLTLCDNFLVCGYRGICFKGK